ncbi:unnamed protein product [Lupinus luteus]|uniref:Histidine-containing phosphotransfer protein n=1 Tax=Lupinus luteus TaxID=3873 RepID=A0AAV1VZD5_LUPLU
MSVFFEDAERILKEVEKALGQECIEFHRVGDQVHQLKGSSSSIGAKRFQKVCIAFKHYSDEQNIEGCFASFQQMKEEYCMVKSKLEILLKVEKEFFAAGGSFSRK